MSTIQEAGGTAAPAALSKMPWLARCWGVQSMLMFGVAGGGFGVMAGLALGNVLLGATGGGGALPLLGGLLGAAVLGGLGLMHGRLRFVAYEARCLPGEGLRLRHGVWWRHETWVPMSRIQHLDVVQGPLDRAVGMASLAVHTAGRHDHRTQVKGLPLAQAQQLRAELMPHRPVQSQGST